MNKDACSTRFTHVAPAVNAEPHATPLLSVRNLRVDFESWQGPVTVLHGISFDCHAGEILGIVGESGAGKSIAGQAILGLIEPPGRVVHGEIRLEGQRIDRLPEKTLRPLRGRRMAMVFQDPLTSLNPVYTIGRHLTETIRTHMPMDASGARKRALELLDTVGIPAPETRFTQYPHQLSGGLRQRVAIALALCADPALLIADEPTTALDVSIQAQIIRMLRQVCKQRGTAVILVSHDMGVIAETADRVLVMRRGKICETGPVHQVLQAPKAAYTRALMAAIPPLDRRCDRLPVPDEDNALNMTTPEPAAALYGEKCQADTALLLEVKGLSMHYASTRDWRPWRRGSQPAGAGVEDINFSITRGHSFGLVGESGSGKSTVARLIAGLLRPDAGLIRIEGIRRDRPDAARLLRRKLQMVFQDPYASLNPRWRVRDLIAEPIRSLRLAQTEDEIEARVQELLHQVRLRADDALKYPHQFSGGQRQRIAIARALAGKPSLIVCDEPTSALDVSVQASVLNLLREIQEKLGVGYVVISHNLAVVRYLCDEIGVMQAGRLVEQGSTEAVLNSPRHAYTRALLAAVPRLSGA